MCLGSVRDKTVCWSPGKGDATPRHPGISVYTAGTWRGKEKAAYGVGRTGCFPGCRVRPKQTEIKHRLFLLRQLETHSKVSTEHDNHSVCSLLPFKQHILLPLPSLPLKLLQRYLGPPRLPCWDLRNPELCRMFRKHTGVLPDASAPGSRCHLLCRNHGGSRAVSSRTSQVGLASQSKQK